MQYLLTSKTIIIKNQEIHMIDYCLFLHKFNARLNDKNELIFANDNDLFIAQALLKKAYPEFANEFTIDNVLIEYHHHSYKYLTLPDSFNIKNLNVIKDRGDSELARALVESLKERPQFISNKLVGFLNENFKDHNWDIETAWEKPNINKSKNLLLSSKSKDDQEILQCLTKVLPEKFSDAIADGNTTVKLSSSKYYISFNELTPEFFLSFIKNDINCALEKRISVVKSIFDKNIKDHRDTQTVVKDYIKCNIPK